MPTKSDMSVAAHNGEVASGLQSIAQGISTLIDTTTRTQETHDMVIKLESKMGNVEEFMCRITKQLDELPARFSCLCFCYLG